MSGGTTWRRRLLPALAAAAWLAAAPTAMAESPAVVAVELPAEQSRFADGAGAEVARTWCVMCHSADYVYMQPPLPAKRWRAVVTKMRKVFGCPLPAADVDRLVGYLTAQNGPR